MRLAALLAATLLLVPAAGLAAPPSATGSAAPSVGSSAPSVGSSAPSVGSSAPSVAGSAFDSTVSIDVHLEASGDARFNVSTAYPLNDSADRAAFERVAADFSEGRVGFQADDFREVASRASELTGRSMEITAVERNAYVRNESGNATGVLSLEFTWTNFADRAGDRILVGDAFEVGWLDHLEPGMALRIHSPPGYGARDAPVAPRNGTLRWDGPHSFEDGGPDVVYLGGLDRSTSTTATATTTSPGGSLDGEFQMALAAVAVLLVGGLLAYVWTRRDPEVLTDDGAGDSAADDAPGPDDGAPPADADGEEAAAGGETAGGPAADDRDGPAADDAAAGGAAGEAATAGDDGADGAAAGGGAADGAADDEPEIDEELLSDEERVERMLRRNGGRMKQANIVTETGWSNAKVSQLLSGMAEEERIEKLRLGRENLIILPEADEAGDEP